ncbi:MAG TPA: DnaJ domain-containing protein [Pseudorhodoplanes sp.]|jgi:hypothetical protein|nr:DnaJ domain-containing protein [Pseudorhodoplanes sp.]
MPQIILGAIVLALVLWALHVFSNANPQRVVPIVRKGGGLGALAGAVLLAARGQFGLAVPLGVAGLSLLGWTPFAPAGFSQRTRKRSGQVSRVRAPFVEMELDHDSGTMSGRMTKGRFEGVTLDALDVSTLVSLLAEVDEESRALLMAYLDRRQPAWRENANADAATGPSPSRGGKMTEEEAYQILGLQPGASVAEIGRAHRSLMKKLHPDQGGSTYLAARVNEAKDTLLRRHH